MNRNYAILGIILLLAIILFLKINSPTANVITPVSNNPVAANSEQDQNYKVPNEFLPTPQEIEERIEKLQDTVNEEFTQKQIIEALSDQKIVLKEAQRRSIEVSDDEVDFFIENIKASFGLDDQQFEQTLADNGYSIDEYKEDVSDTLVFSKLIQEDLDLKNIEVSEQEIDQFVIDNPGLEEVFIEGNPEMQFLLTEKIKNSILEEKQRSLINEYVDKLREDEQ